jgi:DNA-binding NarL/FixJ family response regulator
MISTRAGIVRVLIADDHKIVRDSIRAFLSQQRPLWEISEASDGREAVEQFRNNDVDVAVLDIVMEPMGGVAAAYEIRRIRPDAKIVFISNHYAPGEASTITRLLGAGAFVPKSEAVKALIPTITKLLNEGGQSLKTIS